MLHDLSAAEMRLLAATEGGYDVRPVLVSTGGGDTAEARAFFSNWSVRLFAETRPTALYIGKIRRGAEEFGLSAAYQVRQNILNFLNNPLSDLDRAFYPIASSPSSFAGCG